MLQCGHSVNRFVPALAQVLSQFQNRRKRQPGRVYAGFLTKLQLTYPALGPSWIRAVTR